MKDIPLLLTSFRFVQELVINPEFIVDSHSFDILPGKLG
jgi:hypothetical protein